MNPYISVITLTYNNHQQLCQTLSSIPTHAPVEVIVINGGNDPQTPSYLQQLAKKSPWPLQFVNEPDQGIADGFNKGLKLVRGMAVTFLNSGDSLLQENYYDRVLEVFQQRPNVDFVHSNIQYQDALCGSMIMVPRRCPLGRGMPYHHQTMVVKTKLFSQIGPFQLHWKINMDYDFVCRLHQACARAFYLAGPPVVVMDGAGISQTQEWSSIREAWQVLQSNQMTALSDRWYYFLRVSNYLLRFIMMKMGIRPLLIYLKKKKNSLLLLRQNNS